MWNLKGLNSQNQKTAEASGNGSPSCAPLWVKDLRLLPLNTSGGALASHSFGMGAHTLSLTFAS